jgi:hypothetical protein
MDTKQSKAYLTLSDLEEWSIWKYGDMDDLYHPIAYQICYTDWNKSIRLYSWGSRYFCNSYLC